MPAAKQPPAAAPGPLDPVFLGGSINLLAGSSGAGKTAMLAYMARCFLSGSSVFGLQPERIPYLAYIGVDKSWVGSSSKWFSLENVKLKHYCLPDDKAFQKRRLRPKNDRTTIFHECLAKVAPDSNGFAPGSLVFVDPIALFLGGNLMDYDATAVACMELRAAAQEMGNVCIVGTVHGGKMKSDKKQGYARLQDHILGTAAQHGYSDTQMYLASAEELKSKTATFLLAPHHCKPQTFQFGRDEQGRYLLESGACSPGTTSGEVAFGWLHKALGEAPERTLDSGTIFKAAVDQDISRRTLFRLLTQELSAGRIAKVRHGVYQLILPA